MMISYLASATAGLLRFRVVFVAIGFILFLNHFVSDQNAPYLLDLISLGFTPFRLQVDDFFDPFECKDMTTASYPFCKPQMRQRLAKVSEADVCIGIPAKYPVEYF